MADFSQDISNFTNLGTYQYKFDEAGNEILNPSSSIFQESYFAFPLTDLNYDNTKINSFYNTTFTEFVAPVTQSAIDAVSIENIAEQLINMTNEKEQLRIQLDRFVALSEVSSNAATEESIKTTIINLRTQLGQGYIIADFSSTFPYSPLSSEQQPSSGA